jgi:mannose-1-phosphate guanylyltransferase
MAAKNPHLWGIVLAGGEGKRLRQFIQAEYGEECPKQYCAFTGTRSMLRHTIDRAETLIPPERLVAVVTRKHLGYASVQLTDRPAENVIIQPDNRETAPGILYPLLHVYQRDPRAVVCLFPSDHFVINEDRFMSHVAFAHDFVEQNNGSLVLLGIKPDRAEGDYGWIVSGESIVTGNEMQLSTVDRFFEKPDATGAARLFQNNGLWNTMVVAGGASHFLRLFRTFTPHLYDAFSTVAGALNTSREVEAVESAYATLCPVNFSHTVLSKTPPGLLALHVKNVYWSDWGNACRIVSDINRFCSHPTVVRTFHDQVGPLSLAG